MNTEEYFKAKQRLSEFIASEPRAAALQQEIDAKLKAAGNSHNRLIIIHNMMMDKFYELRAALTDLNQYEPPKLR